MLATLNHTTNTNLFTPDGVEVDEEHAKAVAGTVEFGLAVGFVEQEEGPEDGEVTLVTADTHSPVLHVFEDGHAELPTDGPFDATF